MTGARVLPDAAAVSAQLARAIGRLAPELLSAGRRSGNYWKCGSVENQRGDSLYVHLAGARAGHWQDGATGEFGDALDLVAATQFHGDKKRAFAWALAYLGIAGDRAAAQVQVSPPGPRAAPAEAAVADDERRRRAAHRLWLSAQPGLLGTPAALYLAQRGIDLAALGRQPGALRYHPALPHRESGGSFPAIVAAVVGADGEHAATHRTWLDQHAPGRWGKARVANAKMTLGLYWRGSIRIWRGASGKPLREAPPDEPVVIGEGIETCLSIALAVPEYRVLCAVALGNLAAIALPPQLRQVILAADNDSKPQAQRAFQRAVEAHLDAGRQVRVARPEIGKDFNDVLQAWAA